MERPVALVRYVAVGVSAVYTLLLYVILDVRLDGLFKTLVGWLPLVASVLLLLWDVWLWKLPVVHKLTNHRPRIDGFWRVTLTPTAESHIPEGGNRGPIPAFMMINQSYWSIHLRQLTVESGSHSRAFVWENRNGAEVEPLSFLYENDPKPEHKTRSQRHLGSCTFRPGSISPNEMEGFYFTDRYTQGLMKLTLIDRSTGHSTYDEAAIHADSVSAASGH